MQLVSFTFVDLIRHPFASTSINHSAMLPVQNVYETAHKQVFFNLFFIVYFRSSSFFLHLFAAEQTSHFISRLSPSKVLLLLTQTSTASSVLTKYFYLIMSLSPVPQPIMLCQMVQPLVTQEKNWEVLPWEQRNLIIVVLNQTLQAQDRDFKAHAFLEVLPIVSHCVTAAIRC